MHTIISLLPVFFLSLFFAAVGAALWFAVVAPGRRSREKIAELEKALERERESRADHDADLARAADIQRHFLPPHDTRLAGIDCDACYRPAKSVGGDLYDLADLGDGRALIIVADVCGKGVAASLMMALARAHLARLSPGCESPAALLKALNSDIVGHLRPGAYISAVCALSDTRAGTLTLARAGHEAPLLFDAVGAPIPFESEGMAVGMMPKEIFDDALTETTVLFPPDATLVLYSDGVIEARDTAGEEFGLARLRDLSLENRLVPASSANAEILRRVDAFSAPAGPHDDLTIVTVRRMRN